MHCSGYASYCVNDTVEYSCGLKNKHATNFTDWKFNISITIERMIKKYINIGYA